LDAWYAHELVVVIGLAKLSNVIVFSKLIESLFFNKRANIDIYVLSVQPVIFTT